MESKLIVKRKETTIIDRIAAINTNCLQTMKQTARDTFGLFWKNQDHSPKDLCDMLGSEASKCFELHAGLQELIYAIDNTWVPLIPQYEYVQNEDGTVTIGNLKEV